MSNNYFQGFELTIIQTYIKELCFYFKVHTTYFNCKWPLCDIRQSVDHVYTGSENLLKYKT
jgi:hypothetical protein